MVWITREPFAELAEQMCIGWANAHAPILFQTCKFLPICFSGFTLLCTPCQKYFLRANFSFKSKFSGQCLNVVEFSGVRMRLVQWHSTKKVEQGSSRTLSHLPTWWPAFHVPRRLWCASPKKVEEGRFPTHLPTWPPAFQWPCRRSPWKKQAPAHCAS